MNISIIVENDKVFALKTWEESINLINKKNKIRSIWLAKNELKKMSFFDQLIWYFTTIGALNFFKLSFFTFYSFFLRIVNNKPLGFKKLSKSYNIGFFKYDKKVPEIFDNHLRENKIDILIIMIGFVLPKSTINSVRLGVINKHASLLPSFRGLWPYFWTILYDSELGVSYHLVSENIDSGKILFQYRIINRFNSMTGFYLYVFSKFKYHINEAINNLIEEKFINNDIKKSTYFSLPNKRDYEIFSKKSAIILFDDFFYLKKLYE